ncbi:MAG: EamA family transporter [Candidatus Limnocylindrales bacterium]
MTSARPGYNLRVMGALGIVYVVWGSTYLAIRVMVEGLPPLLAGGIRFVVAGMILGVALTAQGGIRRFAVERRELLGAAAVGIALLAAGNGGINTAEQRVPSSLAALGAASIPLWVVVFRALAHERVTRGTMGGVALGFAGVAVLASQGEGGSVDAGAMAILVVACACWAAGTFASSRIPMPRDPLVSTAVEMLAGGLVLLLAAAILEPGGLPAHVETRSWLALGYLVAFGSLLAFTAYTWLLAHAPVSQVATYAYVNPVIALVLGWAILSEPLTPFLLAGAVLVLVAVAVVIRHEARQLPRSLAAEEAA